MNFLQPFAEQKKRLMAVVPEGRGSLYAKRAAIVIALLFLIPWPLRVRTDATVVPAERRIVSSIEGGVVRHVFVQEGGAVQQGQLLAQLDDSEDRIRLAQAEAALAQARRESAEAEFRNDPSAAGQAKIRADLHSAEVDLEQRRVGAADLRAPIAGIVVTPRIEDKTGVMVKPGDPFCEIVDQNRMAAEMSVPESDLALVRLGKQVALKLNAFPTATFEGAVERIGAQTRSDAGEQYFLVRAIFSNPGGRARDGMVGRVRVRAAGGWLGSGWYPIGYALLRDPFRWIWQKIWGWLP
jgi:RND family efflux transporter MFP subunit